MIRLVAFVLGGAALGGVAGCFGSCRSGVCPLTSTWWGGALYGAVIGYIIGNNL